MRVGTRASHLMGSFSEQCEFGGLAREASELGCGWVRSKLGAACAWTTKADKGMGAGYLSAFFDLNSGGKAAKLALLGSTSATLAVCCTARQGVACGQLRGRR